MRCPSCGVHFHDNWIMQHFARHNFVDWVYRTAVCPGQHCPQPMTIQIAPWDDRTQTIAEAWRQIEPATTNRGPVPNEVPVGIAGDYIEACKVLPFSPKASAALSRRCLQAILHEQGYVDRDLAKEIDLLLNEPNAAKAIPRALRETVDAVRHFGNFSAHPINDKTTLQIIDVEPEEAEWCLEIIEAMFEHFYAAPALAAAKKAALNAKLGNAGKPAAK